MICLIDGLKELNVLHQQYRVHHDIKPHNFILDSKLHKLKLIDFGSAHKAGSNKNFASTKRFKDPHTETDTFAKDIYSMGIVVMTLFPDIYKITASETGVNYTITAANPTNLMTAIIILVDSMMLSKSNLRCTAREALNFCNAMIDPKNDLTKETTLESLANLINKPNNTVDDVLRGHVRPLY